MDWVWGLQGAVDFIEARLLEEIDYSEVARRAFSSSYHFQRVFHILCGYTVGEYIRNRRLTLAGIDLVTTREKVIDIALKYGYDAPDSFTKAFTRFHGVTPSRARRDRIPLKSFSRLTIKISLEGGSTMDYRIETTGAIRLVGYKRRFHGSMAERFDQENDFWVSTRAEQSVLEQIRKAPKNIWHDVDCRFADDGYDHYIAVATDAPVPEGFEELWVPEQTYVVALTERAKLPTLQLPELRRRVVGEWLPASGYVLAPGYEVLVQHWYPSGSAEKFIEVRVPIEREVVAD